MPGAERPLIWVGAGASESASTGHGKSRNTWEVRSSAAAAAKASFPARHPLSLGMFEARFKPLKDRVDECDVILAVGTATDMSGRLASQTVIRIDDDPAEIGLDGAHTHGILGDAALSLEILHGSLSGLSAPRPNVTEDVQAINTHRFGPEEQLQPQGAFMDALRTAIPDEGITRGRHEPDGILQQELLSLPTSPRGYQTSSHHGTLGSVFPVGIGLKIGRPERRGRRGVRRRWHTL